MMPMPRLAKHMAFAICMAQLQGRTDFRCCLAWAGSGTPESLAHGYGAESHLGCRALQLVRVRCWHAYPAEPGTAQHACSQFHCNVKGTD